MTNDVHDHSSNHMQMQVTNILSRIIFVDDLWNAKKICFIFSFTETDNTCTLSLVKAVYISQLDDIDLVRNTEKFVSVVGFIVDPF